MYEKQNKMKSLMKEILQDDYVNLRVDSYVLRENLAEEASEISCKIVDEGHEPMTVEGHGVGIIDALFNGLKTRLADDYPSLESIRFSEFSIQGLISSDDGPEVATEAEAVATVGIRNSEGKEFIFESRAPSVSRAGLQATAQAAEYFINSERTYVRLHEILQHYKEQGRTDLVEKYTDLMTQVVQNTSYSEVVEQIRKKLSE